MSTVPISAPGDTRAPTWEQPFELMEACHQRLQRMLALLVKLRAHMAAHGADEQARQAARDVMRYFEQAAPKHHEDEELHVFPPLLAQGDPATVEVVHRLQADHVRMESLWAAARAVLQGVAEGQVQVLEPSHLEALGALAAIYGGHIEAEERIAYPRAQALLDAAAVQAMGQEMGRRRGAA